MKALVFQILESASLSKPLVSKILTIVTPYNEEDVYAYNEGDVKAGKANGDEEVVEDAKKSKSSSSVKKSKSSSSVKKLKSPSPVISMDKFVDLPSKYARWGRCKLDPSLKAPPVSNVDWSKRITLLST